jgi:hypothetical protein
MSKTTVNMPTRLITKQPVKFLFKDDDNRVECTLEVYKRSVTLYPKSKQKGITVRIGKLVELLEEHARKGRRHRK